MLYAGNSVYLVLVITRNERKEIYAFLTVITENVSSADNQQERLRFSWWIVGFTDGEGCFSVSIFRNKTCRLRWQVMPEFVLTQGQSSLSSLKKVKMFFNCGHIFINKRYDNHHENLYRYCVRRREDLNQIIIPFFLKYQLLTAKRKSFEKFYKALYLINKEKHLTQQGLEQIAQLVGKKIT